MKTIAGAALLTCWALALQPLPVQAAVVPNGPPPQGAAATQPGPPDVATHSTRGTVKTVSAGAIVVTRRSGGKHTESSFLLTPSTQHAGVASPGDTVEIRYRTRGSQRIATAVSVEAPPQ